MDTSKYDADYIRQYYDTYGEREWQRFAASASDTVNFYVHRRYLERYIQAKDHVLDVGAGPGRFTIELAKLGARVTVGDISPEQLDLNRAKVAEAGYEAHIVGRDLVDIVDLSCYGSEMFDAVVCYGGPLSYVFDQADVALDELLRVTRRGGHLLLGVMSFWGTTRRFLPGIAQQVQTHGLEVMLPVVETGDLLGAMANGHHCHMYSWTELNSLLQRHSCTIVAASAANFLSVSNEAALQGIMGTPLWEPFLEWEIEVCRQPGALDGGTHIIVVVRRD